MQLILTGQPITASRALQGRLVSEVVPVDQTVARALEIAQELPPMAVELAKAAVLASFELPLQEGLLRERALVEKTFDTEDRTEGLKAFLRSESRALPGSDTNRICANCFETVVPLACKTSFLLAARCNVMVITPAMLR